MNYMIFFSRENAETKPVHGRFLGLAYFVEVR